MFSNAYDSKLPTLAKLRALKEIWQTFIPKLATGIMDALKASLNFDDKKPGAAINQYMAQNTDDFKLICLDVFRQRYDLKDEDAAFAVASNSIKQGQPWAQNKMDGFLKKFDEFAQRLSTALGHQ